MAETKRETRSPIKDLPVRLPGESLRDQGLNVVFDDIVAPTILVLLYLLATIVLWVQYFSPSITLPIVFTATTLGATVWAIQKYRRANKEVKTIKLGRLGEQAMGQFLEENLRPHGYHVLHDIPGDGFNLDHVVIGATGVYCVETKTHSKPLRGECRVEYDGKTVKVNGNAPDRDPIVQVKAGANWLADLLKSSTGNPYRIQPVVLYPGWFVVNKTQWPEVWVLNEKQFPAILTHQKPFLAESDVNLITFHLKRYVIAKTKEEAEKK